MLHKSFTIIAIVAFTCILSARAESRRPVDPGTTPPGTDVREIRSIAEETDEQTAQAKPVSAKEGLQINWRVISGGATNGNSSSYKLIATVAQTATGGGSSDSYGLSHGFWQDFGSTGGPCDCSPGNADGEEAQNILDVTHIINYLYKNGPAPIPYPLCSGDADCDCGLNILDVTYIINYLYKNGSPPCSCESWMGTCGPLEK